MLAAQNPLLPVGVDDDIFLESTTMTISPGIAEDVNERDSMRQSYFLVAMPVALILMLVIFAAGIAFSG